MKRRTVKRILTYVRPYRAAFAASCASALLYVLFTLLGPVFTGRAIDNILGPGQVDLRGVLYYLALLGISVLLAAASQWVMNVCTRKISSRASNDMRGEAFRVLNRTPLKYIDGHTHGDIISRMVNDADLVAEGLLQGLTQLLPGVATILGTLVVMAVLNPVIALVVVLVTPVSIAFAGFVARRTTGFFKAQSAAQGRLSGFVNEMVAGQSVVKAFGYEDRCFAQFDAISDELYDTGLKSVFYSSVTNPGTRFVNAIVYAAVGVIGRDLGHWRFHYGGPAELLFDVCEPVHQALQRGDGRADAASDGCGQRRAPVRRYRRADRTPGCAGRPCPHGLRGPCDGQPCGLCLCSGGAAH